MSHEAKAKAFRWKKRLKLWQRSSYVPNAAPLKYYTLTIAIAESLLSLI